MDDDEGVSCLEENSAKSSNSLRSTLLFEEKSANFRSSFGRAGAAVERKGDGSGGGVNATDGVAAIKKSTKQHFLRERMISLAIVVELSLD